VCRRRLHRRKPGDFGFKAGVAGRYNHATLDGEKAAALARWDEHLTAVVEGRESNVATSRG
jgi:hypothetical protein